MAMKRMPNPPAPQFVIRVGITGHRLEALAKSGADLDKIREALHQVLSALKTVASDLFAKNRGPYSGDRPILRLISPLAEGADRLAAEVALGPNLEYDLQCPLPFDRTEYERDFKPEESKKSFHKLLSQASAILELDGSRDFEKAAYEKLGRVLVRQSDVLVAVWDGEPGDVGGTEQVVKAALDAEIPVIWIHSLRPEEIRLSETGTPGKWGELSQISGRLGTIFPVLAEEETTFAKRFISKKMPFWTLGFSLELTNVFGRKIFLPRASLNNVQKSIARALTENWNAFAPRVAPTEGIFRQHFIKADYLATTYANKYRNSLGIVYMLGAFTVLAAFIGFFTQKHEWSWLELTLFVFVVTIIFWAKSQYWHGRWIDYRVLAEGLWQARLLSAVALPDPSFHVPVRLENKDARSTWFNWYLCAVIREAGIPNAKIDASYLNDYHSILQDSIRSQIDYHEKTIHGRHHLHHHLHKTTEILFWLAAFSCVMHLLTALWHDLETFTGKGFYHGLEFFLTFCVLVLPAFGAAISAILQQREFRWTALRSSSLKAQLEVLRQQLESVRNETSHELGSTANRISGHMLNELVDWHSVFLGKELSLP
jgi:hypothetical protein